MPEPVTYSAIDKYHETIDFNRFGPDAPKVGFAWSDPMRMFSEIGRDIPDEIRSWLILAPEQRLDYVRSCKFTKAPDETPEDFQVRLNRRWRNLSFIIQEELRAFTVPELRGRGSRDVISAAVNAIVPK